MGFCSDSFFRGSLNLRFGNISCDCHLFLFSCAAIGLWQSCVRTVEQRAAERLSMEWMVWRYRPHVGRVRARGWRAPCWLEPLLKVNNILRRYKHMCTSRFAKQLLPVSGLGDMLRLFQHRSFNFPHSYHKDMALHCVFVVSSFN